MEHSIGLHSGVQQETAYSEAEHPGQHGSLFADALRSTVHGSDEHVWTEARGEFMG